MTSVFVDSYLKFHPDSTVYVCLVDRPHPRVNYQAYDFEIIPAENLEIPAFFNFAFKYDILELNTAVKPFVFKYLREYKGLDRAFYFDPDILIHDRLAGLETALDTHQAVLTPHLTKPLDNVCRPPERVIGMCGIYNLGFVGLQLVESTRFFLDWWCDRLHRYCINDLTNGMFVDQSWMDFTPISGSTPSDFVVSLDISGLSSGRYETSLVVKPESVPESARTIPVTMILLDELHVVRLPLVMRGY